MVERMRLSASVRQPLIDRGGTGGGVGGGCGNQEDEISFTDDFTVFDNGNSGGSNQRQFGRNFSFLNDRQSATAASIYTIFVSLATFFGYCFLLVGTTYQSEQLADVYLGVQASYAAVLLAELTSLCLTVTLIVAIYQENCSLVVPWVLGFIGSISLEALSIVYSNILREHVTQSFDELCYFEASVFVAKTLINIFVIAAVVRFYRQLKNGVTWRANDVYEL